jgi:flagellar biogenesis protein FliO
VPTQPPPADLSPLRELVSLAELLLALAALALFVWVAWRLFLKPKHPLLRVIARLPLEPRRSLYLVEVAGDFFLLGAGEGGLSTLATLDADRVQHILASLPKEQSLAQQLLALAQRARDANSAKPSPGPEAPRRPSPRTPEAP